MKSKTVMVNGINMHYLTEGEGEVVLFLHGLSASSHMWKSVISLISSSAKCIAVDLVGMGKSDKNNLVCSVQEQVTYLEDFVRTLGLTEFTLVMYGWSTIVGFTYAQRHPDKIQGLAFADPYFDIEKNLQEVPLVLQKFQLLLKNDPQKLHEKYIEGNGILDDIVKNSRMNKLSAEDIEHYKEMFSTKESREIYLKTLMGNPYINDQGEAATFIKQYTAWLRQSPLRKLMLYVTPGFVADRHTLEWAKKTLTFFTVVNLGPGISFFPETTPEPFAKALLQWLAGE